MKERKLSFTSIRKKLVKHTKRLLVFSIAVFVCTGIVMSALSTSKTFAQLRESIRANLESKGNILVLNNSHALSGMAEDNAFLAIRELVSTTVAEDRDIAYGIYIDADNMLWTYADVNSPDGVVQGKVNLEDEVTLWAAQLDATGFIAIETDTCQTLEFAAPVFGDGEKLGVIRYGMTTSSMEVAINEAKQSAIWHLLNLVMTLLIAGGAVYYWGAKTARKQAHSLTQPLNKLTEAADIISQGDYTTPITIVSDDEVGKLAENFEMMRGEIRRYTHGLESMVDERTRELQLEVSERKKAQEELEEAQKQVVASARKAGMAEVAAGVLHNVGNVLNSVNVSANLMAEKIRKSRAKELRQVGELVEENLGDIGSFVTEHPQGKHLPKYLVEIGKYLTSEQEEMLKSIEILNKNVEHIKQVVATQQKYSRFSALNETVSPRDMMEDALQMRSSSFDRHGIKAVRQYEEVPDVTLDKHKVMVILVNLVSNAKHAVQELGRQDGGLTIRLARSGQDKVSFAIIDNGVGIPQENLTRIFNHGFTTRQDGHGFGLHSSALAAKELGGSLTAESEGVGKGATFILEIPIQAQSNGDNA